MQAPAYIEEGPSLYRAEERGKVFTKTLDRANNFKAMPKASHRLVVGAGTRVTQHSLAVRRSFQGVPGEPTDTIGLELDEGTAYCRKFVAGLQLTQPPGPAVRCGRVRQHRKSCHVVSRNAVTDPL